VILLHYLSCGCCCSLTVDVILLITDSSVACTKRMVQYCSHWAEQIDYICLLLLILLLMYCVASTINEYHRDMSCSQMLCSIHTKVISSNQVLVHSSCNVFKRQESVASVLRGHDAADKT